jgi:hypothetical protein
VALFGFRLGERSRLAYWVNREYYPDPLPATCDSGDLIPEQDAPGTERWRISKRLEATPLDREIANITDDRRQRQILERIARHMEGVNETKEQPRHVRRVGAKVVPLPEVFREWITRRITDRFLPDVYDFLFDADRRRTMRESLEERLEVGGGPFVVIGHSQGSMVAYDVLARAAPNQYDVRLFLTLGSPLGIQEVQDQLKEITDQRRLSVPPCVRRWVNIADRLDPVAIDPSLSGEYEPKGTIVDTMDWNLDSPRHPHSGTGYLGIESARSEVLEVVERSLFQQVADFVIAEDVTRDLEDAGSSVLHPVLIELGETAAKTGETLRDVRKRVVALIREHARGERDDVLRLTKLQRYVAAHLTRRQVEVMAAASLIEEREARAVRRIWKNARKTALLERSTDTVQARPAHQSYQALGRDVLWAVLDTGIKREHPHFAGRIEAEYDCTQAGAVVLDASDQHGHGTHVAGIIAGRHKIDENGTKRLFAGIAPEARLRIYKVLDADGYGEDAWIIKALDNIAEFNEDSGSLQIHGVNLSLGGPFDPSVFGCGHTPLCRELRRLWQQGVVVVLAAGNEGFAVLHSSDGPIPANMDLSINDPANLEEAIAVGSIHKERPHTYGVSYFSSRGPTADGRQKPDLVAPGERIFSCRHDAPANATSVNQLYIEMSGTSMAAPHVSGMIAAFLSVRREFIGYPDKVKRILLENCTDLGRERPHQGAGMPNLIKMLVST